MKIEFKGLTPSQAWGDAVRRSLAIGIAGWLVVASLQTAGAIPTLYRPSLAPASGLAAIFLTALALLVAYYHNRWRIGACVAIVTVCLPYAVNLLWIRFSGRSLLYPLAAVVLIGSIGLYFFHRRYSVPTLEDDAELAIVKKIVEDFKPTWVDRLIALGIIVEFVLLVILLLW